MLDQLRRLSRVRRGVSAMFLALGFSLMLGDAAWAQGKKSLLKSKEEQSPRSYSFPYGVTLVMIGLGIVVVARPDHRTFEVEIDDED